MKLIIFHPLHSTSSPEGYASAIKIAYLLNGNTALSGICEVFYKIVQNKDEYTIDQKLRYLIANWENEEWKNRLITAREVFKKFKTQRNINSKMMVSLNLMRDQVSTLFTEYMAHTFGHFEKRFKLKVMGDLIHPDYYYFYHLEKDDSEDENAAITPLLDLMQLLLPDPEKQNPMFVICSQTHDGKEINVPVYCPTNENAKAESNCYGTASFQFPLMHLLTQNEMAAARAEMQQPTEEFRKRIDRWASVCYANPNSDEGLEFFRENLADFLPTLKNTYTESPILKCTSELTNHHDKAEVSFGQAPIEQIWRTYRDLNSISEEDFTHLMIIKKAHCPKYEGKWPVMYLKVLGNAMDDLPVMPETELIQSVRKCVSVD